MESEDEEVALVVFDLFIDILEGSAQLLGPHLAALVQWCMAVASNAQVAPDTRGQAAQVSSNLELNVHCNQKIYLDHLELQAQEHSCLRAAACKRTR